MSLRFFGLLSLALFAAEPARAVVRTVESGGYTIEVEMAGSGSPTVLFEAGAGDGLQTWDPIFDSVSETTRAVRYSRVGFGGSSATDRRWTSVDYAREAQRLLQELEVAGPVVLVAHSYGADVARHFAAAYPEQTAGLLLIDPASEHDVDLLRALDLERAEREIEQIKRQDLEAELFAPIIYDIWAKFPKPDVEQLGDLPLTVIASVRRQENPTLLFFEDAARKAWGELHEAWAARFPRGRSVLTEQSGHYVHADEPELVLEELRLLLVRLEASTD